MNNINVETDSLTSAAGSIMKSIEDLKNVINKVNEGTEAAIAGFGGTGTQIGQKMAEQVQNIDTTAFESLSSSIEQLSNDLKHVGAEYDEQEAELLRVLTKTTEEIDSKTNGMTTSYIQ